MQGHKLRGILSVCIKDETGGWWRGQKRKEGERKGEQEGEEPHRRGCLRAYLS